MNILEFLTTTLNSGALIAEESKKKKPSRFHSFTKLQQGAVRKLLVSLLTSSPFGVYREKQTRERRRESGGGGGGGMGVRRFAAHSRVLGRFASLPQIGKLACRLTFSQCCQQRIQQPPQQYSQISPCRPIAITDTPIIRTAAESQKKINYRHLTEINFRYYGLSLMRTLTRGASSVRYKMRVDCILHSLL